MTHSNKTQPGWSFLYSKRWIGYYAMLLIFAIGCVLLANWQFSRREEAKAEISRITNNYDVSAKAFSTVFPPETEFAADRHKWLPFTVTGSYVAEPVLVRNRPGTTGTGSHLVQAFLTADNRIIFVDRGWISQTVDDQGKISFQHLPLAKTGQEIVLTARLRGGEPTISGSYPTKNSVATINPEQLAKVSKALKLDGAIIDSAYAQLISETPAQAHGTLPRKPELDEGPHLSYALQWIVFIAIAGCGIGYAARQEFKHFNRGSKAVARMEAKKQLREQKRRARKGASDAEEEDALLDS